MKSNNIHYILWIHKRFFDKSIYYCIEEYDQRGFILKNNISFENRYKLKLYLDINGIKFNNFKTYNDHSGAKMISYYDI